MKSLLITVFGGLCMFAGMIMLTLITDTYSIREMILNVEFVQAHILFVPVIICILLGAFTKSAQFPFSIWLPGAMEAPTPVSAYLHSATMVKAGIYLVARFTPVFGGSSVWFWLVSGIGIITLLYGSITAVRQTDLKALLAYSTISQLGLIMSLLGIGSLTFYFGPSEHGVTYSMAIFAALFHLFNHSMFKGSLFMIVGIIDHETGTRDIRRLGGLMQLMPVSFTVALIGGFSMAGLPPFNGFLSKEMFFKAVNDVRVVEIFHLETLGILFPVLAWIASIFTFVYSMILVFKTFSGKYRQEKLNRDVHEAPFGMLIPSIILAFFVVIIFFFPNVFSTYLLKPAFVAILPMITSDEVNIKISAWHGWNTELLMTIGVVIIGSLLFITVKRWIPFFKRYPLWLTLNNLFEKSLEKVEGYSLTLTNRYMTGSIRHYFIYIFSFFVIVLGGSLLLLHGIQFNVSEDSVISIYDVGLVFGVMVAALTILFTSNRMTAIVALSVVGYLVTMFFVIFRAPDLALTQMVVETVTTVLFLLCFYHLPKLQKNIGRIKFKLTNLIVSVATGLTITILALSSNSHKLFEPISYFFENAYELAGAKNIVNAILVDFRGFDTMLEISVLCIAGLGVYTLARFRMKGSDQNEAE
jgi:multicomponent Na+:H+ antiporter subunit A